MHVITTREFRANQSKYITMAMQGEEVVLYSKVGAVTLTPQKQDNVITPALQRKIDRARREWRAGKAVSCKTVEESVAYFRSL